MQLLVVGLVCTFHLSAGSLLPSQVREETECEPGAVWVPEGDCNTCFCLQEGIAACSKMSCDGRPDAMSSGSARAFSEVIIDPLLPPVPTPVEVRQEANCTEGDEWMETCNRCVCLSGNTAVCTKIGCETGGNTDNDQGQRRQPSPAEGMKDLCKTGDTWSDECSHCTCVSAGQMVCTYTCKNRHPELKSRTRRQACTPGTRRKVSCNTCTCLRNGVEACSRKFCLTEETASMSSLSEGKDGGCNQQPCPEDCGQSTDSNGCVMCTCEPMPFFGSEAAPAPVLGESVKLAL